MEHVLFPAFKARLVATNSLMPYSLSARQLGEQEEIEAKAYGVIRLLLEGLHRREPSSQQETHSPADSL